MSGRKRMSGIPREIAPPTVTDQHQIVAAFTRWRESLESVRRSIDEATAAVGLLRATLREMTPLWRGLEQLEQALTGSDLAGAIDQAAAAAQEAVARAASLAPRPVKLTTPDGLLELDGRFAVISLQNGKPTFARQIEGKHLAWNGQEPAR